VDTGSKMDQVIFEEFKGTGNSELVLSREVADRRIYPAFDIVPSSTRREELLLDEDALAASRATRRELTSATPVDAMNRLLSDMKGTESNEEFINLVVARSR
jgi:transcription termination factor Rho